MEQRPPDPVAEALAAALAGPVPGECDSTAPGDGAVMDLDGLAGATGMPPAVLEALQREGLLVGRPHGGQTRYTEADASAVRAGFALLQAGVPLDELLSLARRHDDAMRDIARQAVELFVRFVRDPIEGSATSGGEASDRLVTAFRDMLPATSEMVSHHFRRLLLAEANARIADATAMSGPAAGAFVSDSPAPGDEAVG